MIVRVIAVDPSPRKGEGDVLVYQVPERSRAFEFLTELLEQAKVEWAVVGSPPRSSRKKKETAK